MLRLRNQGGLALIDLEYVFRTFGGMTILEEVVRWAVYANPPARVVDVVVQDEYSHDVVLEWDTLHLVFDTNCMGGLYGLAIWDHRPTADELLNARLASGWSPTPTMMQTGESILGHAECRTPRKRRKAS